MSVLGTQKYYASLYKFNPLNAELNPIRHLLALVGARHIVHVSRIRVNRSGFVNPWYKVLNCLCTTLRTKCRRMSIKYAGRMDGRTEGSAPPLCCSFMQGTDSDVAVQITPL